eukprot:350984-Chlamydomonas_euryale.AAC.6
MLGFVRGVRQAAAPRGSGAAFAHQQPGTWSIACSCTCIVGQAGSKCRAASADLNCRVVIVVVRTVDTGGLAP